MKKDHTCTSTHAEMDALKKINNWKNKPKELDLLVIRLSKSGLLGESRPCANCIKRLLASRLKIHNVYYSTVDGILVCEKLKFMLHDSRTYISTGFKKRLFIK